MSNEAVTNTSTSIKELPVHIKKEIETSLAKDKKGFENEKLVKVSIPKNLASRIGSTLPLGINGIRIVLPVDGTTHSIPESFADHLREYLANVSI